jgi:hypothetical protein
MNRTPLLAEPLATCFPVQDGGQGRSDSGGFLFLPKIGAVPPSSDASCHTRVSDSEHQGGTPLAYSLEYFIVYILYIFERRRCCFGTTQSISVVTIERLLFGISKSSIGLIPRPRYERRLLSVVFVAMRLLVLCYGVLLLFLGSVCCLE